MIYIIYDLYTISNKKCTGKYSMKTYELQINMGSGNDRVPSHNMPLPGISINQKYLVPNIDKRLAWVRVWPQPQPKLYKLSLE